MNVKKEKLLLYAVTDRQWLKGKELKEDVESAIKGGITFLQLREKNLDECEFIKEATEIKSLCAKYDIPCIINDNVDVAIKVNADGVHLGQNDMNVLEARKKLGADKIIGVSARTTEQALLAESQGADYLGVGAAFATGTKDDAKVISHKVLKEICETVKIPVVAIGGINKQNVCELKGTSINGVAVVSEIFAQTDIEASTKKFKELVEKTVN